MLLCLNPTEHVRLLLTTYWLYHFQIPQFSQNGLTSILQMISSARRKAVASKVTIPNVFMNEDEVPLWERSAEQENNYQPEVIKIRLCQPVGNFLSCCCGFQGNIIFNQSFNYSQDNSVCQSFFLYSWIV